MPVGADLSVAKLLRECPLVMGATCQACAVSVIKRQWYGALGYAWFPFFYASRMEEKTGELRPREFLHRGCGSSRGRVIYEYDELFSLSFVSFRDLRDNATKILLIVQIGQIFGG